MGWAMLKIISKWLIVTLFASLVLVVPAQSETSYFVTGVEDAILHGYERGVVYEINIMVRSDSSIGGLNVAITNGSLSFSNTFEEDPIHSLLITEPSESGNYENWSFWWVAPTTSFPLGEGESIFNIDFIVSEEDGTLSDEIALSSYWLIPPPPFSSDLGSVPTWAKDLAWFGALSTAALVIVSVLIFSRKQQS